MGGHPGDNRRHWVGGLGLGWVTLTQYANLIQLRSEISVITCPLVFLLYEGNCQNYRESVFVV